MNKKYNGNYYISFECSLTDNIIENKIPYGYTSIPYYLDINRRIFDKSWDKNNITDFRKNNVLNSLNYINPYDVESLEYIPAIKQENYPH
jgi:hypothetical protein